MNYAKLLEINSFFTWHIFLEVSKTQDIPNKIWQILGDAPSVECKIIIGFSSEDAAGAADGQLSFACRHVQAARGGCGKGSVGLPLAVLACATTIVLHLKRTGGINGFSKQPARS